MKTTQHVEFLPWDSQFFGFNIGQLKTSGLNSGRWMKIVKECQELDIICLYMLAQPSNPEAIQLAENYDFHYMDTRLTLAYLQPIDLREVNKDEYAAHRIRAACQQDLPDLKSIARDSHHNTRFYADPNFSRQDCDRLYEVWIENSLGGYAQQVFIAEYRPRLAVAGYITCHLNNQKGEIGLIAVHPLARGKHIGYSLLQKAISWFHENGARNIEVVTQGNSQRAINLYQNAGFHLSNIQLWFHKWFRQPESGKTTPAQQSGF